jgi:hypothetical protein
VEKFGITKVNMILFSYKKLKGFRVSVLKMEMTVLESQEEDAPNRLLFFKPMSWLGQIRPHRRDESWSASL